MRIFRFWVRHATTLEHRDGTVDVQCYGGSDQSVEDAQRDAEQRMAAVRSRVQGGVSDLSQDYEADIREELIERLDACNAITRNRYGALVLNSTDHVFVDIDEPRYSFWEKLFGRSKSIDRKARILADLQRRALDADCAQLGWRIYETHKGIRVIVSGRLLPPADTATAKFMRSVNADLLYTILCRKQGCYRARLTPKPYRMKLRGHKVRYPRDDGQEAEFRAWLPGYESASEAYATCRFLRVLGKDARSPIIDTHDRISGAHSGKTLA